MMISKLLQNSSFTQSVEQLNTIKYLFRTKQKIQQKYDFLNRFSIKDGIYLVPRIPMKPLTSYNIFTLSYMKIIRESYPNEATSIILKKLSSLWNDDEFMIDHKLEVMNLSKFQYDLFYKECYNYKLKYERPKEPLTSYQVFLKQEYNATGQQLNTTDMKIITQDLTKRWHSMNSEEQDVYKQIYQEKFNKYKNTLKQYDDLFKIPLFNARNIYNLYLKTHYVKSKIKFKNRKEQKKYAIQLRQKFYELSQSEKQVYEKQKKEEEDKFKIQIAKFKHYFDLSDQDFKDICKAVKFIRQQQSQEEIEIEEPIINIKYRKVTQNKILQEDYEDDEDQDIEEILNEGGEEEMLIDEEESHLIKERLAIKQKKETKQKNEKKKKTTKKKEANIEMKSKSSKPII